jgi:hypothetical protein
VIGLEKSPPGWVFDSTLSRQSFDADGGFTLGRFGSVGHKKAGPWLTLQRPPVIIKMDFSQFLIPLTV